MVVSTYVQDKCGKSAERHGDEGVIVRVRGRDDKTAMTDDMTEMTEKMMDDMTEMTERTSASDSDNDDEDFAAENAPRPPPPELL